MERTISGLLLFFLPLLASANIVYVNNTTPNNVSVTFTDSFTAFSYQLPKNAALQPVSVGAFTTQFGFIASFVQTNASSNYCTGTMNAGQTLQFNSVAGSPLTINCIVR